MGGETNTLPAGVLYLLMVASALLSGVGDILIFKWAKSPGSWGLAWGVVVWVASLVLMGYLFRYSSLPFSLVVILLIVVHLLIDVAWDAGVHGSRLSGGQWVGVGLAVAAVVLLQTGAKQGPP